jgi:hypothetical protein
MGALRRAQRIRQKLRDAVTSRTGSAATIAALVGNKNPDELMAEATRRFRCVSWNVLKHHKYIICQGGTLDEVGRGPANLHNLTSFCELAACDAFTSHSWRDDPELKWKILAEWCEVFREEHGRAPTLWLDKMCIDQKDISDDLACLPIFLAGCNNLLVIAGETYTCRLWCMLELFVYLNMRNLGQDDADGGDEPEQGLLVYPIAKNESCLSELVSQWQNFDAVQCECFNKECKDKILEVISQSAGGITDFNAKVGDLLLTLLSDGEKSARTKVTNLPSKGRGKGK